MNVQIISSGLPNLFNIEFRRWWGEKRKQGCEPDEIFTQNLRNDYIIPDEFCALSICYYNTMIDKSIPSFETLKTHLSTRSKWEQVLEDVDVDKNRIEKFLKNHISKIEKLYYSEDSKWQRLTKSIKAEMKANKYVTSLLELFGEKNLPIKRLILVPAFYSRAALFELITIKNDDFESLRRFLDRDYNRTDIEVVCPPEYHSESSVILIPLHESGSIAGNPLIFDFTLIHETSHAITRWLYPLMARSSPRGIKFDKDAFFSYDELEIITDTLAMKILKEYIKTPLYLTSFLQCLNWKNIINDFHKLIRLISRTNNLYSQTDMLEELPMKRLRGILEKKMNYQSPIKGLDRNQLAKSIEKRIYKYIDELFMEIGILISKIKKEMRLIEAAQLLQKTAGEFLGDMKMAKFYKELLDD